MVPDYISAKVMKELKLSKGETPGNGDVYPCMGLLMNLAHVKPLEPRSRVS